MSNESASIDSVVIGDISITQEEANETLRAIRLGYVDALVIKAPNGHAVLAMRDADHAYRALAEAMGEGAALVTSDGIVTYHNAQFAELASGPAALPLRGRALRDLVPGDARVSIDAMLERARVGPARIEVGMLTRDGGTSPVQLTASYALIADTPVICVIATDLSEQRIQAELYREALIGMEARERLISVAGHELRAPLQALVFDIGALLNGQQSVELEAIHRQSLQLADIVASLLDVGLIGSNQLHLSVEDIDLADVVRAVVDRSDDVARSGASLSLEVVPTRGRWDRQRLEQVVTNLISNAVKYGLGRPIRLVLDGDERLARLVVEDHGVGVPSNAIDRLFRPFERIGSVKTATGLGLGLYIAAQIVKAHGGVIRVESEAGQGSRFIVELPRMPAER